ncbi:MAG: hypothetical protein AAF539_16745 [Planctomycetota bacterium]
MPALSSTASAQGTGGQGSNSGGPNVRSALHGHTATNARGMLRLPMQSTRQPSRQTVLRSLPLDRLTPDARQKIVSVASKPTLYRRLPPQTIACERSMFLFLTRNPDVLVGLWDLMGITKVKSKRLSTYQIEATDGIGTQCLVDLIYGDASQHIFYVEGSYDGKMTPTPIRGKGVFVLRSSYTNTNGKSVVSGSLDCFVQLDSLGIDLIARTLSPVIGRSADSNFEQTAHFIAQVNEASVRNPPAMLNLAGRLPQVTPPTRASFADTILQVSRQPLGKVSSNQLSQSRSAR